jgi:hypothetical protein
MTKDVKNIASSVHQRLLNKAKESSRPFNELLQHFAIERFIYRLSKSPYADKFILKGALMLSAWCGLASRPTMDIDLLGKIDNTLINLNAAIFDPSFGKDGDKSVQWQGFIRKTKLINAPEVMSGIQNSSRPALIHNSSPDPVFFYF